LLITALHCRGAISGQLGQNIQLVDPRDSSRVIVLAGWAAGHLRQAELMCWPANSYGCWPPGCKHLKTVSSAPEREICASKMPSAPGSVGFVEHSPCGCRERSAPKDYIHDILRRTSCSSTARWSTPEAFAHDSEALEIDYSPKKENIAGAEKAAKLKPA
jgi:hypothetical protein